MTAYTDDAAEDRKRQKELRKRREITEEYKRAAVSSLYDSPEGRRYLWWMLELTGAMGQNPFRDDTHQTAFMCGMQNVGQQLMSHMIEVNPAAFTEMMKEQTNERQSSTNTDRTQSGGNNSEPRFWDDDPTGW